MSKNRVAIRVQQVEKIYALHHEKPTLSEQIFRRHTLERFTALHDINVDIYKGEKVGIVGANGSGKTTLLKLIAGISIPSSGSISTQGKVVSLIDVSAGFHPDLTGEENIFLNGLIVGMSKQEIAQKYASIVRFAGIDGFIDAPFFTYSEGMKLRLGFAVAVHANPDIILLDEGFFVGDQAFQTRMSEKFHSFMRQKKTIVIVSHMIDWLAQTCDRILVLKKGCLVADGKPAILQTVDYS